MKTFIINNFPLTALAICLLALSSCSNNDVAPDPASGLTRIASGYTNGAGIKIEVYASQELFAGFNTVYVALFDSVTESRITQAEIELIPEMQMTTMKHSCPVENPSPLAEKGLFPASILFTMPSGEMGNWLLKINVTSNGASGQAELNINVQSVTPAKVLSFSTANNERYYLSYLFPSRITTGVNDFEIIVFKASGMGFIPAEDLTITIAPEMPSMDHGSPNNIDPTHTRAGHYRGKVNFTMTGEWRINMDLSTSTAVIGSKYFDINVE